MKDALWQSELPGLPAPTRGKVRDIYDLGETLLLVACDRISAYDHILRPAIPGKGKILNQITNFWFDLFGDTVLNHLLATDPADFPPELQVYDDQLRGRSVLVRKTEVVPFECVARGYLAGSAFKEYIASGTTCGIRLPDGLLRASRLPEPIFTPATKAETGHDENVSERFMADHVGTELTETLRTLTLEIYGRGAEHARNRGLILADTKFEFGRIGDELIMIDEVLTPDSSRYWDEHDWSPGIEPASFDKQYVRNWLDGCGWDHESPPPELPEEVVRGTQERYVEAFRRISGQEPEL